MQFFFFCQIVAYWVLDLAPWAKRCHVSLNFSFWLTIYLYMIWSTHNSINEDWRISAISTPQADKHCFSLMGTFCLLPLPSPLLPASVQTCKDVWVLQPAGVPCSWVSQYVVGRTRPSVDPGLFLFLGLWPRFILGVLFLPMPVICCYPQPARWAR